MAFWWVNQNQTWEYEVPGGYLWAPKKNRNGQANFAYDNMLLLEPGDIVFSYNRQAIRAIGIVEESAVTSRKPDFGSKGRNWRVDGWEVSVRFLDVLTPLRPQDYLDIFNADRPARYAPMTPEGRVAQAYLFRVSELFAHTLLAASGIELELFHDPESVDGDTQRMLDEANEILSDSSLTRTERRQLSFARVGQGIFRDRVAHIEPACRLTGLSERRHLIASHIKPWSESNNDERLSGANGLLLSPHVDHLFDRGFISFRNDGRVLTSPQLSLEVSSRWKLNLEQPGRPFTAQQRKFLEFHRDEKFLSQAS